METDSDGRRCHLALLEPFTGGSAPTQLADLFHASREVDATEADETALLTWGIADPSRSFAAVGIMRVPPDALA